MIEPRRRARIAGATACAAKNIGRRFTPNLVIPELFGQLLQRARSSSAALLTSTSMGPSSAAQALIAARNRGTSPTSQASYHGAAPVRPRA